MINRNTRSQKFPNPSPWDDSIQDFFPQLPDPKVSVHFSMEKHDNHIPNIELWQHSHCPEPRAVPMLGTSLWMRVTPA